MQIPAYQIHNVLNTYSLRLFKSVTSGSLPIADTASSLTGASSETRREAVIDKVATEIVQRITRLDSLKTRPTIPSSSTTSRTDVKLPEIRHNLFVFQTLDIHNNKMSRSLSIEDSIFFVKRNTEPVQS